LTLRESAAKWRQVATLRDLQFEEHLEVRSLPVMGDENALRRVIDILFDNAIKYSASPGKITLSAEEKNGRVAVNIEDTGVGIAPEDQARIFERFYRVDKARSRELGGAGLGLAIAQWIVQHHNGIISVKSEIERGSVFRVEIPVAISAADEHSESK
jgi:signal transduction histidine kinase